MNHCVRELDKQCRFGLNAAALIETAMKAVEGHGPALAQCDPLEEVFRNIHSMLCHAANVSKLLWPSDPPRKLGEDGKAYRLRCKSDPGILGGRNLRNTLRLPKEAQDLKDRRFRNLLEHFDSKLDAWLAAPGHHNAVDQCIGDRPVIPSATFVRFYNPKRLEFTLWDEIYDVGKLHTALKAVRADIERFYLRGMTSQQRRNSRTVQAQVQALLQQKTP